MAERVAEQIRGRAHPRRAYPWDEWADGSTWKLKQGEDYFVPDNSFRGVVYAAAKTRGLRAKTKLTGDGVMLIQFEHRPPVKKLRPRKKS